ncbi:MAPEG family protein [Thalassotalea euphylliae]|uniref:MAPEG family protein n=1 Tax=Thalassotalea euphylliae TaxID=1655234 RepID=UPI003632DF5C
MGYHPLFLPLFGMVLLTCLVWIFMYTKRLSYVTKHRIAADRLHLPEKVAELLPDHVNAASNNLKNLFEMPVLFYVTVFVAASIHDHSVVSNLSAWAFLFLRILHSIAHCMNGKVMPRFIFYVLSCLALFTFIGSVFGQMLGSK